MYKDIIFQECKYRFKKNSCEECPLNCVYKNKATKDIKELGFVLRRVVKDYNELKKTNEGHWQKLEKIKEIAKNQTSSGCSMRNKECDYSCNICHLKALNDILQIIEKKTKGEQINDNK